MSSALEPVVLLLKIDQGVLNLLGDRLLQLDCDWDQRQQCPGILKTLRGQCVSQRQTKSSGRVAEIPDALCHVTSVCFVPWCSVGEDRAGSDLSKAGDGRII